MPLPADALVLSTAEQLAYIRTTFVSSGIVALRRLPQSKFRSAFNFPPPSTFIGALLYPLLRDFEKRETTYEILQKPQRNTDRLNPEIIPKSIVDKYKGLVRCVAVRVLGESSIYGGLLKINWYDTHPERMEVKQAATSLPFAVYYGNFDHAFNVVYFIDFKKLEEVNLSLKDIARAAYGVSRLGSRESVAYSDMVSFGDAKLEDVTETETTHSFILDSSKSVLGNYSLQQVSDWRVEFTNPEKAPKILVAYPKEKVKLKGRFKVAEVESDYIVVE